MNGSGTAEIDAALRGLPSVDELLTSDTVRRLREAAGDRRLTRLAREAIESLRSDIREGRVAVYGQNSNSRDQILKDAGTRLEALWYAERRSRLRRVINATGVLIHTNLGRAPLSEAARAALAEAAANCTLEYDLETGKRGGRAPRAEQLLCEISGAEAAVIVNNGAAAAFLVLSVFAAGREVVVSRGELVEIGGDFRVPDVLVQSGAVLREVGTTNRTKLKDYAAGITDSTALILKVHPSNYRIIGFTESPRSSELAELAHNHGIMLYEDAGSGVLVDLSSSELSGEPVIRLSIACGTDLVSFSGDKLLGGPQAGIICGRSERIKQIRKHPLYRTLRVDKLAYAALEATLESYARGMATEDVPVLRMLSVPVGELQSRAERFVDAINHRLPNDSALRASVVGGSSVVGGGAAPEMQLPSKLIELSHRNLSTVELAKALRSSSPPVIARIEDDEVLLDLRTVSESDEHELLELICGFELAANGTVS